MGFNSAFKGLISEDSKLVPDVSGQIIFPIINTLGDGTDRLSRNAGKKVTQSRYRPGVAQRFQ